MIVEKRQRRGFTILEALLCLAIAAMLIAIAFPSFKRVTLASEETAAHSALRQSAVATITYASDHRTSLPFLVPVGSGQPTSFAGEEFPPNSVDYFFDQTRYWATVVMPWFNSVPHVGSEPILQPIEVDGVTLQRSRIWMTSTAFAAPGYWKTVEPPDDPSLFRGTRLSEIHHPSRKGLLVDIASGVFHRDQQDQHRPTAHHLLVATGDGAVASYPWPEATEIVLRVGAPGWPIMSTRGGVAGIDFPYFH